MKVKLSCTYCNSKGEKIGEPGDELEMTPAEARLLINGGSAVMIEPPKKSEREI